MKTVLALAAVLLMTAGCSTAEEAASVSKIETVLSVPKEGQRGFYYVQEFTPKTAPDITCVFVRDSNAGGLSCFPKGDHQ